jgi:hypothetical protein
MCFTCVSACGCSVVSEDVYLVFAPASDVPDERELRLAEVVFGEPFVELIHRQVDDVVHLQGYPCPNNSGYELNRP